MRAVLLENVTCMSCHSLSVSGGRDTVRGRCYCHSLLSGSRYGMKNLFYRQRHSYERGAGKQALPLMNRVVVANCLLFTEL